MPPGLRTTGPGAKTGGKASKKSAKLEETDWAAALGPQSPSDDGDEPLSDSGDASEGALDSSDDVTPGRGAARGPGVGPG